MRRHKLYQRCDVAGLVRDRGAVSVGRHHKVLLSVTQRRRSLVDAQLYARVMNVGADHEVDVIVLVAVHKVWLVIVVAARLCVLDTVHVALVALQVVLVSEHVAAERALELALGRVRADVRPAHGLRLEAPRAAGEVARVRPRQVVHALVLVQRRLVRVRVAARVTEHAALTVHLAMCMDRGVDARRKLALVAAEQFLSMDPLVNGQIGARLEGFATDVADKVSLGAMRLRVLAEVAKPTEHLATSVAWVDAGNVLFLQLAWPAQVFTMIVIATQSVVRRHTHDAFATRLKRVGAAATIAVVDLETGVQFEEVAVLAGHVTHQQALAARLVVAVQALAPCSAVRESIALDRLGEQNEAEVGAATTRRVVSCAVTTAPASNARHGLSACFGRICRRRDSVLMDGRSR